MEPLVEIESLTLRYRGGDTPTLEDINLHINVGERILILGPSGCGKSSLLHVISGVIPELIPAALSGKIKLNYSNLGILLQNPKSQMISTTVEEELAFSLENQGLPPPLIREKVEHALRKFRLNHLRSRKSNSLSGGETQRVALISAIISEPDLLLLDEPTSYLDFASTVELLDIIRDLPQETTTLIVEHRWDIFIHYVDRVIIFNEKGKIIFDGSTQQFLTNRKRHLRLSGIWDIEGLFERYSDDITTSITLPPLDSQSILTVRNLSFSFHNTKGEPAQNNRKTFRLSNINLSFKEGESTVILGDNGAGKTTLIENIAAFFEETFKYIYIYKKPYITLHREEIYSNINYVPQNPEYIFLKERVIDELHYNLNPESKNESIFNWEDKLNANPFSLSEGEKRRLSLTILFNDPRRIILMDEPTYGLDFRAYITLIEGIKKLKKETNILIIVSHDINFATIVADRIVVMESGKIIFDDSKGNFLNSKLYTRLIWQKKSILRGKKN